MSTMDGKAGGSPPGRRRSGLSSPKSTDIWQPMIGCNPFSMAFSENSRAQKQIAGVGNGKRRLTCRPRPASALLTKRQRALEQRIGAMNAQVNEADVANHRMFRLGGRSSRRTDRRRQAIPSGLTIGAFSCRKRPACGKPPTPSIAQTSISAELSTSTSMVPNSTRAPRAARRRERLPPR